MSAETMEHREGDLVEGESADEPVSMSTGYKEEARRHMMTCRPKEYRRLMNLGEMEETLDRRMEQFDRHSQRLVHKGYQHQEMMKVLLPLYVYPPPEPGAGVMNKASAVNINQNEGAQDENKVCGDLRGRQNRIHRRQV